MPVRHASRWTCWCNGYTNTARRQRSKHDGLVRKLVDALASGRQLLMQQFIELLQRGDSAVPKGAALKRTGQCVADRLPFRRLHQTAYTAVRHDFHLPVGQVEVDQDAAIFFGVPDPVV